MRKIPINLILLLLSYKKSVKMMKIHKMIQVDQVAGPLFICSDGRKRVFVMSKSDTYVKRAEEFLENLQKSIAFELVDVEFVKEASTYYLRVYCDMDKEGGISIDDCVEISRNISDWLDKEDFISEEYILEVSSPGLGRTLKKDKDFKRELGKEIELKTFKAIDKQKEFVGILKNFDENTVTVEIEGNERTFNRSELANIRLTLDF
jgi:ribosome maturation factor rimP